MTLKSDAKCKEKLTLGSKNDMRNLVIILMCTVASPKIWTLMCYFCRNYIMFVPQKGRGVTCHSTEEWCKIWGGTDLCIGEFWPHTRKSQNLHFNGLLLTKVYNVWAKKLQSSYVSWHWSVMQYLKKIDWWFEKWHKEVGKVLDEKVQKSYVSWHWRVIQRKANSCEIRIFVWCNRL